MADRRLSIGIACSERVASPYWKSAIKGGTVGLSGAALGETVAVAVHFQDADVGLMRSSSASVKRSDPKVSVHSSNGSLLVMSVAPRSLHCEIRSNSNSAPVLESGTKPSASMISRLFWRHQSHFVTTSGKEPTQMMCTAAGFHRDNAALQLLDKINQCLSPHCSTQSHGTLVVNTNDTEAVLPNVDTQYGNLNGSAPFPSKERHHTRCSRKGGPSHNQDPNHHEVEGAVKPGQTVNRAGGRGIKIIELQG